MVGSIVNFSSASSHSAFPTRTISSVQASSVNALYGDPDLLIKEYFQASAEQRAKLRSVIASRFNSFKSILTVLGWTHLATTKDAYDGAVDLLAECQEIRLMEEACEYLLAVTTLANGDRDLQRLNLCERSWTVLLKGIGCAYRLRPQARLSLLQKIAGLLLQTINRRSLKAILLDSLAILFDEEVDKDWIRTYVEFLSQHDRDEYIRGYAEETLAELGC
jgi:hypothetical protein